jgi:hypothetical protein
LPLLPIIPAPAPVEQSSYVVGSDSSSFVIEPYQTIVVTFPNLPRRSVASNPLGLRQVVADIPVRQYDQLQFTVSLQGVAGVGLTIMPIAVDTAGVRTPGPFLGGGNTYRTFQAKVTAGATGGHGTIVASLVYSIQ